MNCARLQKRTRLILLVAVLSACFGAAVQAAPDPTEQLKPFIDKVTDILSNSSFENDPKCEICQRVIDVARERFDFHEMSQRVLGKQWAALDSEEKGKFVDLFTQLLQWAYIGKIEEYAGQTVQYVDQRVKGNRAEVKTLLVDQQRTIPVSYIMILKKDQWMVYDVVVEGVSLVRNYMEQFRDILRTEDFPTLVNKIEDKIKELEAEESS